LFVDTIVQVIELTPTHHQGVEQAICLSEWRTPSASSPSRPREPGSERWARRAPPASGGDQLRRSVLKHDAGAMRRSNTCCTLTLAKWV